MYTFSSLGESPAFLVCSLGSEACSNKPPTNVEGKAIDLCPSARFTVSSTLDKKPAPLHARTQRCPPVLFLDQSVAQCRKLKWLPAFPWSLASGPSPPLWIEVLELLK